MRKQNTAYDHWIVGSNDRACTHTTARQQHTIAQQHTQLTMVRCQPYRQCKARIRVQPTRSCKGRNQPKRMFIAAATILPTNHDKGDKRRRSKKGPQQMTIIVPKKIQRKAVAAATVLQPVRKKPGPFKRGSLKQIYTMSGARRSRYDHVNKANMAKLLTTPPTYSTPPGAPGRDKDHFACWNVERIPPELIPPAVIMTPLPVGEKPLFCVDGSHRNGLRYGGIRYVEVPGEVKLVTCFRFKSAERYTDFYVTRSQYHEMRRIGHLNDDDVLIYDYATQSI